MTLSLACPIPSAMGFGPFVPEPVARPPVRAITERFAQGLRNVIGIGARSQQIEGRATATCEAEAPTSARLDLAAPHGDPGAEAKRVFTDYLLSLDPTGEPPSEDAFEAVWSALGKALRTELIRRGLWHRPPSFLGVYGFSRWSERGSRLGHGDAIEELLADCYTAIFIHRLSALLIQLKTKPQIEGLVRRAIKNFLHDLQKRHDRLGFRVFKILQSAIKAALAAGELHVLAGDSRIRNTTALGVTPEVDPGALYSQDLEDIVEAWNDHLLPDLITANAGARQRVTDELRGLLLSLPDHGVDGFLVKQVIEPLKNDARHRWNVMRGVEEGETAIEGDDGELIRVVRKVHPDDGVEQRDRLRKLSACMATALDRRQAPPESRADLATLWEYLKSYDDPAAASRLAPQGAARPSSGRSRFPSVRKLAALLSISRGRLPALFRELESLVSACLENIAEGTSAGGEGR